MRHDEVASCLNLALTNAFANRDEQLRSAYLRVAEHYECQLRRRGVLADGGIPIHFR
jgi:hypothetical protein